MAEIGVIPLMFGVGLHFSFEDPGGPPDCLARRRRADRCSNRARWPDGYEVPFVVAEENRELVEELQSRGINAVAGDAVTPSVLIQSHVVRASILVVATPDSFKARRMMEIAYMLNPRIQTVVRTHTEEEAELLRIEGAGALFVGEYELAASMTRHVLNKVKLTEMDIT